MDEKVVYLSQLGFPLGEEVRIDSRYFNGRFDAVAYLVEVVGLTHGEAMRYITSLPRREDRGGRKLAAR